MFFNKIGTFFLTICIVFVHDHRQIFVARPTLGTARRKHDIRVYVVPIRKSVNPPTSSPHFIRCTNRLELCSSVPTFLQIYTFFQIIGRLGTRIALTIHSDFPFSYPRIVVLYSICAFHIFVGNATRKCIWFVFVSSFGKTTAGLSQVLTGFKTIYLYKNWERM